MSDTMSPALYTIVENPPNGGHRAATHAIVEEPIYYALDTWTAAVPVPVRRFRLAREVGGHRHYYTVPADTDPGRIELGQLRAVGLYSGPELPTGSYTTPEEVVQAAIAVWTEELNGAEDDIACATAEAEKIRTALRALGAL